MDFVAVKHSKTKQTASIPVSALSAHEANGWSVVATKPPRATRTPSGKPGARAPRASRTKPKLPASTQAQNPSIAAPLTAPTDTSTED